MKIIEFISDLFGLAVILLLAAIVIPVVMLDRWLGIDPAIYEPLNRRKLKDFF